MWNQVGEGVTEPPERGHGPANRPAQPRRAAPRQRTVVRQRLGEAHGYSGADRSCHSNQECAPGVVGRKCRRKQRRERRDGTVHQAGEAWLHVLQHENAARGLVLRGACALGQDLFLQVFRVALVLVLGFGELHQQLAN